MLEIYGVPFSAHTRKVIVAAQYKQVAYHLRPVVPIAQDGPAAPPANWSQLSPLGTIPVAMLDGVVVRDSSVILQVLERAVPTPPLIPADPAQCAQALWFEEYVDGDLQQHVLHGLLLERAFSGFLGRDCNEAVARRSVEIELPHRFEYLDQAIGDRATLAREFSVADIAVTSILLNYHYAGEQLSEASYPNLHRYLHAQLRRPCFLSALREELPAAREIGTLDTTLVEDVLRGGVDVHDR